MEYGAFALEVRVNGRTVREYQHQGEIWIEGRKGSDFTLRIHNRSGRRVLAVPTVDGLSVMNGEEASYESSGYVIDPYHHVDIPGWRLDNDKVASFRFHKSGKSYAAKTDKPHNIGVIGCGFFSEKQPEFTLRLDSLSYSKGVSKGMPGIRTRSLCSERGGSHMDFCSETNGSYSHNASGIEVNCCAGPAPAASEASCFYNTQAEPSLGTEFGSEMAHKVVTTTFQKAHDKPDVEMAIRYGDREELKKRGVDLEQRPVVAHKPSPFPKEETGCKPPPGWSGR